MSFAGGSGHKSPFAERAKATRSHLSPRRSSTASGVGNARSAQQSLFGKESTFGGKEAQFSDSSAKVSQLRNAAQPDVKEPTTPTKASEGSNSKGNRRDEFSSFNNRRVGTPVKTPRTAFGTIPPRSPKRPYMGSPKYQKVLLERPAFYNSPAAGEPSTESGKKEVSISELQKRLKRFLQDENLPTRSQLEVTRSDNLGEVPYNISRSPRVNPLFHHDDTVLQVAKGGVAFTAGVDFTTDNTSTHCPADTFKETEDQNSGFHFAKGGVAFTAGVMDTTCTHTPVLFKEEKDVSTALQKTPSPETVQLISQSVSEDAPASSTDVLNGTSESSEMEQSLRPEDFPVHSECDDGNQVEEVCDEDACVGFQGPSKPLAPEMSNAEELPPQMEQKSIGRGNTSVVEVQECLLSEEATVLNSSADETAEEEALEDSNVEVPESTAGAAVEYQLEAKADYTSEEEVEEEIEILESWSQRFLKFVVLAVMVACVMGIMVLASGSQGLLPKSLHSTTVAGPFSSSSFSSSVIPISIGFMGLGKEHEGMPCLPAVHLGLEFLSSTSKVEVSRHECSSPGYPSGSHEPFSVTRKDSELAGIENVVDLDQLKTATDYYKELQGRLFSDVASLTSETALSDSSKAGMAMDGEQSAAVEDVPEIATVEDVAEVVVTEDVSEFAAIEVVFSEDVSEFAAIEVVLSEDVSESAAMEDVSELVDEIAEEQHLKSLSHFDEFGREVSEETLIAQNSESLQNIPDATSDPETDQLPADVELDVLNLVNHVPDEGLHVVPTSVIVSIDTIEHISSDLEDSETDSEPAEVTPSVVEISIEEPASSDILAISDEVAIILSVPPVTGEVSTEEYPIASSAQGIDEDSSENVDDLVDNREEEHVNLRHEEPQSQSTTELVDSNEESAQPLSEVTYNTPVSKVVVPEELALEEPVVEGSYPMATIGLLVAALALAVPFLLNIRKSPTVSQAAIQAETTTDFNLFPGTAAALKTMGSPVAWPTTRSVYDSHIPDRDELDAISSPLKSTRTLRKYGVESYSTKYGSLEPALSAPGLVKSPARVEQKPATTWHPAMKGGGSTISSSYRQTASYIPTIPSESGISTSTRGASDMDSVCESALTMGAEEWEHLGSFTTTELVSVNEGGEEQKIRTPVRRSQRIRNRLSPLPVQFT